MASSLRHHHHHHHHHHKDAIPPPPSPAPSTVSSASPRHDQGSSQQDHHPRSTYPPRRKASCLLQQHTEPPPSEPEQRPPKRARFSIFNNNSTMDEDPHPPPPTAAISADTTENVRKDVGPFLKSHIPTVYSSPHPNTAQPVTTPKANTQYCYRHRPDVKCRRPADEPTVEQLQSSMESLPEQDQQAITHVWTLFSAAPAPMRKMMLQGILQQCCFPQLSFLSAQVRELIRIDFLTTLPPEIAFKILSYLDTTSLCKAAQVSRAWRMLADDDVVWHKMCEQHIDRKCDKCGWGLPLLERKRLRASKRQMELRAKHPSYTQDLAAETGRLNIHGKRPTLTHDAPVKRTCSRGITQPWKKVFSERYKVESNWRRGRCRKREFRGHTDGIMCLQFDDGILATGSYDSTIKIWDLETGELLQTLRGHTSGVRCLQFDDTKLISGSMDKTLKIWNYRTGKCISTLPGHTEGVVSLHFDSTLLVSGSVDTTVKVWNFADKSCFSLKGHADWVNSVRIDSDSRTIFSASDDGTIKMWDLDSRRCIRTFTGHVGHVQQVIPINLPFHNPPAPASPVLAPAPSTPPAPPPLDDHWMFSRDPSPPAHERTPPPNTLLTAALDGTIRFWDVATGNCTKTLFGHVEGVWAIAADTLRVVSGAQDSMVKVWDVETGRCVRTVTGHVGPVTSVALGDSRMVTGGEDGVARLYCFGAQAGEADVIGEDGGEGDGTN